MLHVCAGALSKHDSGVVLCVQDLAGLNLKLAVKVESRLDTKGLCFNLWAACKTRVCTTLQVQIGQELTTCRLTVFSCMATSTAADVTHCTGDYYMLVITCTLTFQIQEKVTTKQSRVQYGIGGNHPSINTRRHLCKGTNYVGMLQRSSPCCKHKCSAGLNNHQ